MRKRGKRRIQTTSTETIVTTTAMKQRQAFKRTKKIGGVTVTIPCFGKSRSRSR